MGTYDIKNMEWLDIVSRIEDNFGIGIYQAQSRILRTENIMITIFDSGLNKFVFSKLMEWNITYGIFNTVQKYLNLDDIIVENYLEESEFLEDKNEKVEKQKLQFKNKEKIIITKATKKTVLNIKLFLSSTATNISLAISDTIIYPLRLLLGWTGLIVIT